MKRNPELFDPLYQAPGWGARRRRRRSAARGRKGGHNTEEQQRKQLTNQIKTLLKGPNDKQQFAKIFSTIIKIFFRRITFMDMDLWMSL